MIHHAIGPSILVELGFVFMAKIYVFVDGFNLYHALDTNPSYHSFKWLSLMKLSRCFIRNNDTIEGVEYFTTLATWDPAKVMRHKLFIKANEIEDVKVTYCVFKESSENALNVKNSLGHSRKNKRM